LAALSGLVGLRLALRRRKAFPKAEPLPSLAGPPRLWLKHAPAGPVLLNQEEQLGLVWGVDRYVAETPTRQLDIPATVRATAKTGGLPVPVFQRARHARSLWLWLDESAEDARLRRLAEELSALLSAHGLPLETATFWGAPHSLRGGQGERFAPREIEERRDTAWVAILTDGQEIARQDRQDDQRAKLDSLLRGLSHWPSLWFVDASAGATGLPALLKRHGLECLPAGQLARRMASGKNRRPPGHDPDGWAWEAACALAPAPVDNSLAWRLRSQLKLRTSPWATQQWQARAAGPGGRWLWPAPLRARLVNGLWAAERQTVGPPAPRSLFAQALDFWLAVYEEEGRRCQREDPAAWAGGPARQHWRMERALLNLWRQPSAAITELYRLFQGPLKPAIREQLAHYAPHDPAGAEQARIRLPWAWAERSGREQKMLHAMGFGGAVSLRPAARQWLGLALVLGLGLGAGWAAWRKPPAAPTGPPEIVHGPGRPTPFQQHLGRLDDGQWRLTVGTDDSNRKEQILPAGALARVDWNSLAAETEAKPACAECPEMVELPPGEFLMGSPDSEKEQGSNEGPQHKVKINYRLAMGKYEATFAEWDACEAAKVCPHADDRGWGRGLRPVIKVSWNDAQTYIRWLNGLTGQTYRLPSEAEWEYAARAGTTTPFSTGDCITTAQANYDGNHDYNSCGVTGTYLGKTQPVGSYPANPWGLFDMHGNVLEWVQDCYHDSYNNAPGDGSAWDLGTDCASERRVLRGGSWDSDPRNLFSASRDVDGAGVRGIRAGFRLARTLTP
jgi:formylglycine-generating enzyme required for sulfatase activity